MKLSNKGRYGVRALFDIAFHNRGRPTQVKDIAERQVIPLRFLEQIFQDLKRAGLVSSKRGPRGGYQLALPPGEVKVGDIVRALEGPIALTSPTEDGASGDPTSRTVTEGAFEELANKLEACLDSMTLEDLCAQAEALGGSHAPRRYVYSI